MRGGAGSVLRTKLLSLALVLIGLCGQAPKAVAETAWLGLIAGPPAASETVLAGDMASLLGADPAVHVLPMLGDAGAGNIALLLNDPRVDIAFVSTDALAASETSGGNLGERLELVARLYPQEVHILAGAEIGSLAGLAGKKVNFGPVGCGSAATAAALFEALGIKVEAESLDADAAVERLKQGTIAAAVVVGGKPSPLVSGVPANFGIHLLPIPFGAPLEASYLPTRFGQEDYPNLIQPRGEVATVGTGMVLLAAKAKSDPGASERVARFVEALFPRFPELEASDRHPKWREVNLAASLPGFTRTPAAEAWLGGHPVDAQARPLAARTSAIRPTSLEEEGLMSKSDKEALFKRFIEWQQAKRH
jgi:uncharacterized protein